MKRAAKSRRQTGVTISMLDQNLESVKSAAFAPTHSFICELYPWFVSLTFLIS